MANKYSLHINPIIHQSLRLQIMVFLMVEKEALFLELEKELQCTPGNLGAHLKILADASLVHLKKYFKNSKPVTQVEITRQGEQDMRAYVQQLKEYIT